MEQQAVCHQWLSALETRLDALARDVDPATAAASERAFERMVLALRRDQTHAATAWLDRVAAWVRRLPEDARR